MKPFLYENWPVSSSGTLTCLYLYFFANIHFQAMTYVYLSSWSLLETSNTVWNVWSPDVKFKRYFHLVVWSYNLIKHSMTNDRSELCVWLSQLLLKYSELLYKVPFEHVHQLLWFQITLLIESVFFNFLCVWGWFGNSGRIWGTPLPNSGMLYGYGKSIGNGCYLTIKLPWFTYRYLSC